MPFLDWYGRKAVENYHQKVPYYLLQHNSEKSFGHGSSGNLIIQGDNLIALKALLPYYAGRVKCIYIDPPYNTGKENWIYNDNVNSPEIQEWLGKVVGKEMEDLSRHDKWLCMMYPRLKLAQKFLTDDGIIFISIDDSEMPSLRIIMDEIFPKSNSRLCCFAWQTEGNFDNQAKVKICHEYILAYVNDYSKFQPPPIIDPNIEYGSKLFKDEIRNTIVKNGPKNPVSDIILPVGFPANFEEGVIKKRNNKWPHYSNDVIVSNYEVASEVVVTSGWSSKNQLQLFIQNGFEAVIDTKNQETIFEINSLGTIECVKNRKDDQSHVISVLRNVGTTQQASKNLALMGLEFDYPKPVNLIKYLISTISGNDFIVMDFFAGSGTTGQAVLEQNSIDNGKRNFILVEIDKDICNTIILERCKKIINGYSSVTSKGNNRVFPGLGSGFDYCELGEQLFSTDGRINETVSFIELAQHVYFTETGAPLQIDSQLSSPLIGIHNGIAIYLLYNGILGDRSLNGGNVLTTNLLDKLPLHNGPRIIYGASCRIGPDRLKRQGITFRQIPYEVRWT